MSRYFVLVAVFAFLGTAATVLSIASTASTTRELTKAEVEFVELCKEMESAFKDYYARADKLKDPAERTRFRAENDPSTKYVTKLTEFERTHHGTLAALMAAKQLLSLGVSTILPGAPVRVGYRHALTVLGDYAQAPELPSVMGTLILGVPDPEVETFLRHLMNAPATSDQNRVFAKYMLAQWAVGIWDDTDRGFCERRIEELEAGATPSYPGERNRLALRLPMTMPSEKIAELQKEAVETLESLSASSLDVRMPGVVDVDRNWRELIVDVDAEKTKSMPLLKDMAAGVLFRERHLRIDRPAPELSIELVSGKKWSLAEQVGKVVVIQFSFKGCGPCEAMYPDLLALTKEHGEKLVILTVMADEKHEVTTAAVESGKLTWNVYWDGRKGPVATKWAVSGFPTVYVVGPDGRIAADAAQGLRGEPLRTKIAELMR